MHSRCRSPEKNRRSAQDRDSGEENSGQATFAGFPDDQTISEIRQFATINAQELVFREPDIEKHWQSDDRDSVTVSGGIETDLWKSYSIKEEI